MEENQVGIEIVLIGGSAGSLEILVRLLPLLPKNASYALVVVLHRKSGEDMTLEELIAAKSALAVVAVEDKTAILPGNIYIAPADYHLLFEKDRTFSLDISEKVNYSRPSIDVSFDSAAQAYGPAVAAILLSGANADGTEGLQSVKSCGGVTAVQKPESAEMPFMPQHAIENAFPDFVFDFQGLANFLAGPRRALG